MYVMDASRSTAVVRRTFLGSDLLGDAPAPQRVRACPTTPDGRMSRERSLLHVSRGATFGPHRSRVQTQRRSLDRAQREAAGSRASWPTTARIHWRRPPVGECSQCQPKDDSGRPRCWNGGPRRCRARARAGHSGQRDERGAGIARRMLRWPPTCVLVHVAGASGQLPQHPALSQGGGRRSLPPRLVMAASQQRGGARAASRSRQRLFAGDGPGRDAWRASPMQLARWARDGVPPTRLPAMPTKTTYALAVELDAPPARPPPSLSPPPPTLGSPAID